MLDTVANWMSTIPLADPWRAIVMVIEVLLFSAILHTLWELGFSLAGKLFKSNSQPNPSEMRSTSPRNIPEIAVDAVGDDQITPKM